MKTFLDENFMLESKTAQELYFGFARDMPIIDYHSHLPPCQVANDIKFDNLTAAWLQGDHYKWRAMRTNGIPENYCTGNAADDQKFMKWAETVPYSLRNPLYHWTHLELQRYFGVKELLNKDSAIAIYHHCTDLLQTQDFSVRNLLRKMNVKFIGTTDDPVDSLEHHATTRNDGFEIKMLPSFRPDKAIQVEDPVSFLLYLSRLEAASNIHIATFQHYLDALKNRHDFFATMGCTVADHGMEQLYVEEYSELEIVSIFEKVRSGQKPTVLEARQFKSFMLVTFAEWNWEKGWVQQYHLGALRNNNSRMMKLMGPDTGWDSIGDFSQAKVLARFLDRMDSNNQLAKTILYNLNPADNEVMASMTGNFNDGSFAGKIQYGSGWWFLDQKEGILHQLNALSNMSLLSRFIGMLTDSRSFLSFPRHEYFRRILCNLLGEEMEHGELPNDLPWTGQVIKDICYYNASNYFNWKESGTPSQLASSV